jgi:outer membrane protein
MKQFFYSILVMTFVFGTSLVHAETAVTEQPVIAIVDLQKLMAESKAAKSIRNQGTKIRNDYKKRIKKIEKDLSKLDKKLLDVAQDKDSTADAIKKQRDEFQERLIEGQKETAQLNQKLDISLRNALGKLSKKIIDITEDIADDDGYDIVLSKANVITVTPKYDITDQVMSRLNKTVKSISVKK